MMERFRDMLGFLVAGIVFVVLVLILVSPDVEAQQGGTQQTQYWDSALVSATDTNTVVSLTRYDFSVRFTNLYNQSYQSPNRVVIDINGDGVAASAGTAADYTDQIVLDPGESILVEAHLIKNKRFGVICAAGETASLYWKVIRYN